MQRAQANRLMTWATRAAVAVAVTLVASKAIAWWLSGSAAMLGSLADSSLDLMASLVTLFAVKTAITPADEDHRFGHGKAEALAGLFQAAFMAGSALFLLMHSVEALWAPKVVSQPDLVIQVSLLAIALSLALVVFQSYVVRKTGSLAVAGDHLHYKGDLLMNAAVIAAAYISSRGFLYADGLFALGIALYIFFGAYEIARPAIDMLMDRELSPEDREAIFNMVLENPRVLGMHKLKTRQSGRDIFIQMHLEVDAALTVKEAHFISVDVEAIVGESYPDAEIIIHLDTPSEHSDTLTFNELMDKESK